MFRISVIFALFAAAFSAPITESLNSHWESFKTTHKKNYQEHEEPVRRIIWEQNLQKIHEHNMEADMGKHTYWLGLNEYADLTNGEFVKKFNGFKMAAPKNSNGSTFLAPSNVEIPTEVDWRKEGYVTPVKNQGQCGSCWSFSATGSLEGQHFRKTGKLVSLSEQNLMDCSHPWGNNGCEGGLMDYAFQYIKDNKGVDTEESYPYEAKDKKCRYNKDNVGATDTGYTDIKQGDEEGLKQAAATVGPISVAIDASHMSFQLYRSGVYSEQECSSTQLDHGVLVVGYGTESGSDYWLVKNSWGESWGMDGYIKMSRNQNNQCGIATSASYPLV